MKDYMQKRTKWDFVQNEPKSKQDMRDKDMSKDS